MAHHHGFSRCLWTTVLLCHAALLPLLCSADLATDILLLRARDQMQTAHELIQSEPNDAYSMYVSIVNLLQPCDAAECKDLRWTATMQAAQSARGLLRDNNGAEGPADDDTRHLRHVITSTYQIALSLAIDKNDVEKAALAYVEMCNFTPLLSPTCNDLPQQLSVTVCLECQNLRWMLAAAAQLASSQDPQTPHGHLGRTFEKNVASSIVASRARIGIPLQMGSIVGFAPRNLTGPYELLPVGMYEAIRRHPMGTGAITFAALMRKIAEMSLSGHLPMSLALKIGTLDYLAAQDGLPQIGVSLQFEIHHDRFSEHLFRMEQFRALAKAHQTLMLREAQSDMCGDHGEDVVEQHDFPVMCTHGIRALGVDEYVWDTPSWLRWQEASAEYEKTLDASWLRGFGGSALGALSSSNHQDDACFQRTDTALGCPYTVTIVNFWKGQARPSNVNTRSVATTDDLTLTWHSWEGQVHVTSFNNAFVMGSNGILWTLPTNSALLTLAGAEEVPTTPEAAARELESDALLSVNQDDFDAVEETDVAFDELLAFDTADAEETDAAFVAQVFEDEVDVEDELEASRTEGVADACHPLAPPSTGAREACGPGTWTDAETLENVCTIYTGAHYFHNPFWQDSKSMPRCVARDGNNGGDGGLEPVKGEFVHFMQCCLHNYGHFLTEAIPRLVTLLDVLGMEAIREMTIVYPVGLAFQRHLDFILDVLDLVPLPGGGGHSFATRPEVIEWDRVDSGLACGRVEKVYYADWVPAKHVIGPDYPGGTSVQRHYAPALALQRTREVLVDAMWWNRRLKIPPRGSMLVTGPYGNVCRAATTALKTGASLNHDDICVLVYVSRGAAKTRSVTNEDFLTDHLRSWLTKNRPECHFYVHDGTLSEATLDRTAWYFQHAIAVLGAYGAALNDMLFTPSGTPLILFPVVPHVDFYYEHLAASLGLEPVVHISSMVSTQQGNFTATHASLDEVTLTLNRVVGRQ